MIICFLCRWVIFQVLPGLRKSFLSMPYFYFKRVQSYRVLNHLQSEKYIKRTQKETRCLHTPHKNKTKRVPRRMFDAVKVILEKNIMNAIY